METPKNPIAGLMARKKVLKIKMTKAKHRFASVLNDSSSQENIRNDLEEFNSLHKEIREIFNEIYEIASDEDTIGKFVDEEYEMKQIYRHTRRLIESYLANAQLSESFSKVFTQDDVTSNHVDAIVSHQSTFKGFEDQIQDSIQSRTGQQDNLNDSMEFLSIQGSKNAHRDSSSTPIDMTPLVSNTSLIKPLPLNPASKSFEPLDNDLVERFLKENRSHFQPPVDPELRRQQNEVQRVLHALEIEQIVTTNQRRDVEIAQRQFEEQRGQFHAEQSRVQVPKCQDTIVTPLRLERFSLPVFDGAYDQWGLFQDMYELILHNSQMTTIEEFQRLRKALSGSVAAFITNVPITEANYLEVWTDIKTHYDNPRRTVASHVQAILDLNTVNTARSSDLRTILDHFKSHMRALRTAGQGSNAKVFQMHVLLSKLDPFSRKKWEAELSTTEDIPKLQYLYDVIEKRIRVLEVKSENVVKTKVYVKPAPLRKKLSLHATGRTIKCHICERDHLIYKCPCFNNATPQERLRVIDDKRLCHNCFSVNHQVMNCNSGDCQVSGCNQRHLTIIHDALHKKDTSSLISTLFSKFNGTVLATALVIMDVNGQPYTERVLLNGGSRELKLSTQSGLVDVSGIGKSSDEISQSVTLRLSSHMGKCSIDVTCLVMEDITEKMPQEPFEINRWKIPRSIKLADPEFNKPSTVDVLLSASVFFDALIDGMITLGGNKPRLFDSHLRWLIVGGGLHTKSAVNPRPIVCHELDKRSISQRIEQSLEAFPEEEHVRSADVKICESHFVRTSHQVDSKLMFDLPLESRCSSKKTHESPTYADIVIARMMLAHITQQEHFPQVFNVLKYVSLIQYHSKLLSLNPVWNENLELIKVGGRSSRAELPEPRKLQIIISSVSISTQRLFETKHQKLLLTGPQLMLHQVRHQWWPVDERTTARKICHKCVTCCKRSMRLQTQIIRDLPECCLTSSKLFLCTDIDFDGPFKIEQSEKPGCKTRESCIHLKFVPRYASDAFMAYQRRFVLRRGRLRHVYYDDGTNFVGANNMLRKMLAEQQTSMQDMFEHIEFHFTINRSLHADSLCKANVRSMKKYRYITTSCQSMILKDEKKLEIIL